MTFTVFSLIFLALKLATQDCYSEQDVYSPPQGPVKIVKVLAPNK